MPGADARIVDPDTGDELGTNAEGLLRIRGANVMLGYLNQPEKTAAVVSKRISSHPFAPPTRGYLDNVQLGRSGTTTRFKAFLYTQMTGDDRKAR